MKLSKMAYFLLAGLSGVLVPMALPNDVFLRGNPFLALVALVPLYLALAYYRGPFIVCAFGALYGALFHGLSSYWLFFFKDYRVWTIGTTTVVYAFVYACVCVWLALAMSLSPRLRPLFFSLGWVAYEYMKSKGFLGFPYGLMAYTWNKVDAFNQLADITGVYGPSFLLCLANSLVAECLIRLREPSRFIRAINIRVRPINRPLGKRHIFNMALVLSCLWFLSLSYGFIRLALPFPSHGRLQLVLVQPNEDSWSTESEKQRLLSLEDLSLKALKEGTKKPDLMLWTENTLDRPYDEYGPTYYSRVPKTKPLSEFIDEQGIPLLTGAPKIISRRPFEAQNAVMLIDGQGHFTGYYSKIHPVPFAESVPFWEYQWMKDFMKRAVGMVGAWTTGSSYTMFSLPTQEAGDLVLATPICFETSFADIDREFCLRGANILINLTNVSWSQRASAEIQHSVSSLYRCIENRVPMVQSTNSGLSCWIDEKGRIHDPFPLFTPHSAPMSVEVKYSPTPTLYTRCGDTFALSCLAIFVIYSILLLCIRGFGRDILTLRQCDE